jgi:DNA-binding transcriptional regulator YiaG
LQELKDFRISLGLTISGFADEIKASKSLCEKVESGDRKPSREFITKLKTRYPQFDTNLLFKTK